MAKRPVHSYLQNRILLYLAQHNEVVSLISLARILGNYRSATRQAMHTLQSNGLVSKTAEERWILTPEGIEEVKRIKEYLAKRAASIARSIIRMKEQLDMVDMATDDLIRVRLAPFATIFESIATDLKQFTIERLVPPINADARPKDAPLTPQQRVADTLWAQPTLAETASRDLLSTIRADELFPTIDDHTMSLMVDLVPRLVEQALRSFSQSQRLSLAAIERVSPLGEIVLPLVEELSQVNLALSHIISDVGIIRAQRGDTFTDLADSVVQIPAMAEVARTYTGLLVDSVDSLGEICASQGTSLGIVIPTEITWAYVDSVRREIVPDYEDVEGVDSSEMPTAWQKQVARCDAIFRDLGADSNAMWHDCWETLRSDNPDRIRQVAHLGREFLRQYLEFCAPDSAFEAKEIDQYGHEGRVTRKMRVGKILTGKGDNIINWAHAIAKAVDETYHRLTAVSHNREACSMATEQQLTGLINAMGGLVAFIEGSDAN